MILIVKAIAILLIVNGCILVLRPKRFKAVLEYFKEGNRAYIASGIKAVLGFLIVLTSGTCSIPWVIFILGLLLLASGVSVFFLKKDVVEKLIDLLEKKTPKQLKLIGTITFLTGVLVFLAV